MMNGAKARINLERTNKIGTLTRKEVFRWHVQSHHIISFRETIRSDIFTFSPLKNSKLCLLLEYDSDVTNRNLFSITLRKIPLAEDHHLPIKVTFSFLDNRNRFHHSTEKVMDMIHRKVRAHFDLVVITNQQLTLLKNDLFTVCCSLDVEESIHENNSIPPDVQPTDVAQVKPIFNHQDLVADMTALFDSQKLYDVTITADLKEFNVHRAILAARSPVFAAMFEHETKEKLSNRVNVCDIASEVLQLVLKYIYTSEVGDIDPNTCLSLYIAADKYCLPLLKSMCSSNLSSSLTSEVVVTVLTVASFHEDTELKDAAVRFILSNAVEVMKREEWLNLLKEDPSLANSIILQLVTRQ